MAQKRHVSCTTHVCSVSRVCSVILWVCQYFLLHSCYLLQFILSNDTRSLVRNVRFAWNVMGAAFMKFFASFSVMTIDSVTSLMVWTLVLLQITLRRRLVSVRAAGFAFGLYVATLSLVLFQFRKSQGFLVDVEINWGSLGHCPKKAPEVLRRRNTSGTSADVALPVFSQRVFNKNQPACRMWNGGGAFV